MTFKENVGILCKEIEFEFPKWKFVSGSFKNSSLKYADLNIRPGFYFDRGDTPLQPSVVVAHKKSMKLCKKIIGIEYNTSLIDFQDISSDLQFLPEKLGSVHWILENKKDRMEFGGEMAKRAENKYIDITEVKPVLVAMVKNGISIIERYYDLSSEENLLRNLPPKYTPSKSAYEEMEQQKGVMFCITRIMLGDFDFIEHYRSDAFKTEKPKRIKDLDAIIAALPELKRRYEETGSVI